MLKTIGILGGMGPLASNYFERLLIGLNTIAQKDQDHVPFVHVGATQVPSRVAFLNGNGADPVPMMIEGLKTLEMAGAELSVIPCNTSHILWDKFSGSVTKMELIHLIKEASKGFVKQHVGIKKVGIIATIQTVKNQLYHRELANYEIEVVNPERDDQELIMDAIFAFNMGVKATGDKVSSEARDILSAVIKRMALKHNLTHVIDGCTEVSVVFGDGLVGEVRMVDPLSIVAREMLKKAGVNLS